MIFLTVSVLMNRLGTVISKIDNIPLTKLRRCMALSTVGNLNAHPLPAVIMDLIPCQPQLQPHAARSRPIKYVSNQATWNVLAYLDQMFLQTIHAST
jgi:hypothetical protein